jgi:membrane-anchored mycosin MYCP
MTSSHVVGKRGAAYRPREILVSLAHLDQVLTVLNECKACPVTPDASKRSDLLELALVSLDTKADLPTVQDALLSGVSEQYSRNVPAAFGDDDLDPVLAALRAHFAERHGGWAPTIGKNRLVGWVGGVDGIVQHNAQDQFLDIAEVADGFPARESGAGAGVTVGVLDTGIANHPWLAGGWTAAFHDVLPDSTGSGAGTGYDYLRQQGHATFVAGLVLSQAPSATVRVRSVLDSDGKADLWTVANAIVAFGRTGGLDILNLSFACYTEDGQPPLALSTALGRLDPAIRVVAAAGNHGGDREPSANQPDPHAPAWPAALDRVIAVGAMDGDQVADFTPKNADWINAYEQGVNVLSTYLSGRVKGMGKPFHGWAKWTGTSFAAAQHSGKLAAGLTRATPA